MAVMFFLSGIMIGINIVVIVQSAVLGPAHSLTKGKEMMKRASLVLVALALLLAAAGQARADLRISNLLTSLF